MQPNQINHDLRIHSVLRLARHETWARPRPWLPRSCSHSADRTKWCQTLAEGKSIFNCGPLHFTIIFTFCLQAVVRQLFCRCLSVNHQAVTNVVQGVLALCEFHQCEFHYCDFSKLSKNIWLMRFYTYLANAILELFLPNAILFAIYFVSAIIR